MRKVVFSLTALLLSGLLITACKKDNTEISAADQTTAQDILAHNDLSEQLDAEADDVIDNFISNELDERGDCPSVSFAQPKGTWPNTITLDYSDAGCTKAGRTFKGQVIIQQSEAMNVNGATRSFSFQNFFIEGVQIEGSRTVTNAGINTAGLFKFNVSVDETFTFPDGTQATFTATRARTLVEGGNTATRLDNVWEVTGQSAGVNRNGDTYSTEITSPLVKKAPCAWISAGIISFTANGLTRSLDFGDGTCDRDATLTLADGSVKEIKIKHYWWK